MPRLTYKNSISLGEAISSVCFFGIGIVWLSKGLDFLESGDFLRAFGLFVCAFISVAASLRFVIQNILYKIFVGIDENEEQK